MRSQHPTSLFDYTPNRGASSSFFSSRISPSLSARNGDFSIHSVVSTKLSKYRVYGGLRSLRGRHHECFRSQVSIAQGCEDAEMCGDVWKLN